MDTFNDKVSARTALAERLQSTHGTLAREVGILPEDLDVIVREGRAAADADAEQRAQEAEQSTTISIRAAALATLRTRETELRARIPAVVADLERGGDPDLALFLRRLSFERFQLREVRPEAEAPAPSPEESEVLRRVTRVVREDDLTRLAGLVKWVEAVLESGREPIVRALANRGLSAEALRALADDARAAVAEGPNLRRALEATEREKDAVLAQRARWNSIRKLVRLAAKRDREIATLLAAC
jgi:hypothetical protein